MAVRLVGSCVDGAMRTATHLTGVPDTVVAHGTGTGSLAGGGYGCYW